MIPAWLVLAAKALVVVGSAYATYLVVRWARSMRAKDDHVSPALLERLRGPKP